MKRTWIGRLAFGLGIACSVAPVVAAAAPVLTLAVGPHLGGVYTTDSEEALFTYGAAARLGIFSALTAELALQYQTEKTDGGEISTLPVQLSGMLNVLPFLHATLGIGYYNVDATLDALGSTLGSVSDTASEAALHLGAGVNFPMGSRGTLTGELRYVFLDYNIENAGQSIPVNADFWQITGGVLFRLF